MLYDVLALGMDFWRKSRMDRINNDRVTEIMKVETTIMDEIQKGQLVWYGHLERMSGERLIMNWLTTE